MARHKSAAAFTLTATDTHGRELFSFSGSLLHILDVFNEANYFTGEPIDNYARISRELRASGGAYSRYFAGYQGELPVRIEVLAEALQAPASYTQADELETGRGAVAAAADAEAAHRYASAIFEHPDRLSAFGTSPVVAHQRATADFVPVACSLCGEDFLQNPEFGNIFCPGCQAGERSPLPRPSELVVPAPTEVANACGTNNHSLPCSRLSKWQQKQYGCTCAAKRKAALGDYYRLRFTITLADGTTQKHDETTLAGSESAAVRFFMKQYQAAVDGGRFAVGRITKARFK